jgi:lipocalin
LIEEIISSNFFFLAARAEDHLQEQRDSDAEQHQRDHRTALVGRGRRAAGWVLPRERSRSRSEWRAARRAPDHRSGQ